MNEAHKLAWIAVQDASSEMQAAWSGPVGEAWRRAAKAIDELLNVEAAPAPPSDEVATPEEPMPNPTPTEARRRDGPTIHDGEMDHPHGCPRKRGDCWPLARVASPNFESYMCCGETSGAPVPTDTLRLCIKSTHDRSPVDLLVNLDDRDAIDAASVLLAGLSSHAQAAALREAQA